MKKSSIILLGYGLGYVIISILVAIDFISLSSQDILPLSIASLIFSLAEFWNVGVRLIILSLRQLAFRFFAMMAFTRFKKFKTYVEKAYLKKSQKNNLRFNFELYFYWYNKCIANHFSRTLRRQLENLHKTSSISLMLNVAAPVALVVLFAIMPHSIAVSLVPLGLMFINVFFESEFATINEEFLNRVDFETKRLKDETDDFKKLMTYSK